MDRYSPDAEHSHLPCRILDDQIARVEAIVGHPWHPGRRPQVIVVQPAQLAPQRFARRLRDLRRFGSRLPAVPGGLPDREGKFRGGRAGLRNVVQGQHQDILTRQRPVDVEIAVQHEFSVFVVA
jgi:hypothetical protein